MYKDKNISIAAVSEDKKYNSKTNQWNKIICMLFLELFKPNFYIHTIFIIAQ